MLLIALVGGLDWDGTVAALEFGAAAKEDRTTAVQLGDAVGIKPAFIGGYIALSHLINFIISSQKKKCLSLSS